jgi:excisionase family DNA binding protein
LDDRALVGAAITGDDAAWREIVRRHSAALREAVRETHRVSEIEVDDVVSDFWLSLIENDKRQLRRFDPGRGAELLSWLTVRLLQVVDRHALLTAEAPETVPLDEVKYLVSDPPSHALRGRSAPTMMKVEEVAERWDLNVKTVYAMISRGELLSRRCGRVVRIPRHVVESFEKQASVAPERMPKACR